MSFSTPPGGPRETPGQRSATRRSQWDEPGGWPGEPDPGNGYGGSPSRPADPFAPAPDERPFPSLDPPAENRRRLRRPHKRRASAGQQTGLDPSLQSDLPSWLGEERVATAPARRVLSLSVAGFAGLLCFGLVLAANTQAVSYGIVIFGVQVLFVLAWTLATRPPGGRVVAGVGLVTAAAADVGTIIPQHPSLAPLGFVTVLAFVGGVIAQLGRGSGRDGVTESLSATLIVVVGVISFAALVVLSRHPEGTQSIVACLLAAGVALVVARLADTVLPRPRISTQVSRGSIGVVLGAMAGTAAAGLAGGYLVGLDPKHTTIAGLVTAMAAVLADLAVSYVEAGRELEGKPPTLWVARHMQGPLAGFALAAPAAYVLSVMLSLPAV